MWLFSYVVSLGDVKYAKTSATSEDVATAFVTNVICRHSVPRTLLTDLTSNFTSSDWRTVCSKLMLPGAHLYAAAVHQSTNGMAERMVAFVKHAIYAYIDEGHSNWCGILPYVEFAYRTTVVEGLGLSPFHMLYARSPVLPLDMLYREPPTRRPTTKQEYHHHMLTSLQRIYKQARGAQLRIDEKKARLNHKNQIAVSFKVGEWVLVWTPKAHKRGLTTKLMARFAGPYKVLDKLNHLNYRVQHMDNNKIIIVHVQRMIKFHLRSLESYVADTPIQHSAETLKSLEEHRNTGHKQNSPPTKLHIHKTSTKIRLRILISQPDTFLSVRQ